MQGKYWPDQQKVRHIEIDGVCWLLDHLRDSLLTVVIPEAKGSPSVTLKVSVKYSSHCVSRGPKQGHILDFDTLGHEAMVVDHRNLRRAFHPERHTLSFLLPGIIETFAERRCFFTGKENFMTYELGPTPDRPADAKYEIFFNARKGDAKNTVKLFIESAYVRDDEYADNAPVNFKQTDKITAWKLFLKKVRGTEASAARGKTMASAKRKR